jgi:hypothetical protein
VESIDVTGEMAAEADAIDFVATARAFAEMEGFIESDVNFPRGAKRNDIAQEFLRDG